MIEFILYTMLFVYLGISVIIFIILTVSVLTLGGWQALADAANETQPINQSKPMTSNRAQWAFVNLVLFWPAVFTIAAIAQ